MKFGEKFRKSLKNEKNAFAHKCTYRKSRRWTERGIELSSKEMTDGRAHQSFARAPKRRKKKADSRKLRTRKRVFGEGNGTEGWGGKKSKESTKK